MEREKEMTEKTVASYQCYSAATTGDAIPGVGVCCILSVRVSWQ